MIKNMRLCQDQTTERSIITDDPKKTNPNPDDPNEEKSMPNKEMPIKENPHEEEHIR